MNISSVSMATPSAFKGRLMKYYGITADTPRDQVAYWSKDGEDAHPVLAGQIMDMDAAEEAEKAKKSGGKKSGGKEKTVWCTWGDNYAFPVKVKE